MSQPTKISIAPVKYCQTSSFVARVLNHLQIPQLALPLPDASGRGPGGGVENPSVFKIFCTPAKPKTQQYRALQPFRLRKTRGILGAPGELSGTQKGVMSQRTTRFKKELDRSEWFIYSHMLDSPNFNLIPAATQVARPANPKGTNLFLESGQVYNAAERRSAIPKSGFRPRSIHRRSRCSQDHCQILNARLWSGT